MNSYIITQNKRYFQKRKHSKSVVLDNAPAQFLSSIQNDGGKGVRLFLYDYHKKKIFGEYGIENVGLANDDGNIALQLLEPSFRRGIYYDDCNQFADNSVYEICKEASEGIVQKLSTINNALRHSILSTTLEENKFCLKYIDISKDFFVAEREVDIDLHAFALLIKKYNDLINEVRSEKRNMNSFVQIGRAFMNMFLPDDSFNRLFCRGGQVVYLECDEASSIIPWTIFVDGDLFLSECIVFSYLHLKNHFYPSVLKDVEEKESRAYRMAIVVVENEDLEHSLEEARFIEREFAEEGYLSIDSYNKKLDYLEFMNICESYDILHIITHGNNDGLVLSDEYVLTHQSIKNICNAPQLVFLSTCGSDGQYLYSNRNVVSSFLASGVCSVIGSVGKLPDNSENYDFVEQFYRYYMHKHSDVSTAYAYNFALRHLTYSNIRYLFFGIPTIM